MLQSKSDDYTYHDSTASQTSLGPASVLIGRKEEQASHTDTLDVKRHENGPKSLDVELTTSLASVGLVSTPVNDIFVGKVKKDKSNPGECCDNRLDDRVDNGDTHDKTCRRECRSPSEGVHFVFLHVSFSGSATGQNVTEQVHNPRDQTRVGLGSTRKGGGKDKCQEEDGSTRKLVGKQGGDLTGSVAQIAESIHQTGSKSDDKETVNDLEEPESAEEPELNVATTKSAKKKRRVQETIDVNPPLSDFTLHLNHQTENYRQEHEENSKQGRRKDTLNDSEGGRGQRTDPSQPAGIGTKSINIGDHTDKGNRNGPDNDQANGETP